jgi:hypothetical protein
MATKSYAAGTPVGNNEVPIYGSPAAVAAIATTIKDTAPTASSIRTLTENTTAIEVGATGGPVYIKWLTQAVVDSSVAGTSVIATGAANFDHMIPAASVRRFVVPIVTNKAAGYGSFMGANVENGLYPNVAVIGGTGASVISITQYGSSNSY